MEDSELPMFDLSTISAATKNFSSTNVVGAGGFGTVYKVLFNPQYQSIRSLPFFFFSPGEILDTS